MSEILKRLEKKRKKEDLEKTTIVQCSRCLKKFPSEELIRHRRKFYCPTCLTITKTEESKKRKEKSMKITTTKERESLSAINELIDAQKRQVELLEQLLKKIETIPSVQTKVGETERVKELIQLYIRGKMVNDDLPIGSSHRTFRVSDFVKRMMEQWNVIIERELVEKAKEEMEAEGTLVPTGPTGKNARYVLNEFLEEHTRKLTGKDKEIFNWLLKRDFFTYADFAADFFPKKNPKFSADYDYGSANRKIKVLIRRQWIVPASKTRPKSFAVRKEILQDALIIDES
ncbi:MAG: hypothetical protein ACTSRW_12220 [Candidatus Helarchaeota archaeon]